MEFVDAVYVAPAGGPGRAAEPNPFDTIVAEIALKLDTKGKPLSKGFTLPRDDNFDKALARAKRQLSEAGAKTAPAVTVIAVPGPYMVKKGAVTVEDKSKALVTFWTVKRQTRTRKPVQAVVDAPVTAQMLHSA